MDEIISNIKTMRFNLMELSGGLGDLGTFIPLVAGITIVTGMDIGIILIFAGIFNIFTGIIFGQPIPVQPMKAIAVVAIAEQLLPGEIAAAGLITGMIVFLLGVSGLTKKIEKLIPKAIIRGIQLGIGIKLILKGISFITNSSIFGLDSIFVALFLSVIVLVLRRYDHFPSALFLFVVGIIILFIINNESMSMIQLSIPHFIVIFPTDSQWLTGLLKGAVPQIPLTLLNSVFAVCILSGDLFPGRQVSTNRMATSVGFMNLIGCGFGGLPMCHGSGGLAGQYHFGARTGGSVVILGFSKLFIGLFWGVSAMKIIQLYPLSILGILLFFAGVELASPVRDQKNYKSILVVVAVVTGILLVNATVGLLFGIITYTLIIIFNRK